MYVNSTANVYLTHHYNHYLHLYLLPLSAVLLRLSCLSAHDLQKRRTEFKKQQDDLLAKSEPSVYMYVVVQVTFCVAQYIIFIHTLHVFSSTPYLQLCSVFGADGECV